MTTYFVTQNRQCHGTEFRTWDEARTYLLKMQTQCPHEWYEGRILGPGCDDTSDIYYTAPDYNYQY